MKRLIKQLSIISVIAFLGLSGCAPHIHLDFMGKERMQEVVLTDTRAKEKILVLDLTGTISTQRRSGLMNKEGDLLSRIHFRLKKASEDPLVKGVILRLDTPGGEGTASDIIYNEVMRFRKNTGIPVLAMMMSVAASGGYYVACGCDAIYAHPTTITGSIGVIAVFPGVKKALDKLGVSVNIVKTGEMKDAGSPFRELSESDRAYYRDLIDVMYRRFLGVVHESRKAHLSMEEVKELADGRVFTAKKALELKLIDGIGYFDDALKKILDLASLGTADVVAYTYYPGRKTNIYSAAASQGNPFSTALQPLEQLLPWLKTGIYYLWLPQN